MNMQNVARWKRLAGQNLRDMFVFVSQKCKCDNVQVLRQSNKAGSLSGLRPKERWQFAFPPPLHFFPSFNQAA